MREQYYQFVKANGIQDVLSWIDEIPYSKKLKILEELFSTYGRETLNVALRDYDEKYIRNHRVIPMLCRNILVNLCKIIEEKKK